MFESINENIRQCTRLSEAELARFHSLLEHRTVRKRTFLLQEGEVCNFEAFVLKGCIRTYYLDENGFEVILHFAVEGWWVSDIASFYEQKPSSMFIEALEDCELLVINHHNKELLFQEIPALERMFRLMVQRNLSVLQERLFTTVAKSAEERYLCFIARYPDIPQRVKQHYIASYLGISPEFLSKIRSKKLRKK